MMSVVELTIPALPFDSWPIMSSLSKPRANTPWWSMTWRANAWPRTRRIPPWYSLMHGPLLDASCSFKSSVSSHDQHWFWCMCLSHLTSTACLSGKVPSRSRQIHANCWWPWNFTAFEKHAKRVHGISCLSFKKNAIYSDISVLLGYSYLTGLVYVILICTLNYKTCKTGQWDGFPSGLSCWLMGMAWRLSH